MKQGFILLIYILMVISTILAVIALPTSIVYLIYLCREKGIEFAPALWEAAKLWMLLLGISLTVFIPSGIITERYED